MTRLTKKHVVETIDAYNVLDKARDDMQRHCFDCASSFELAYRRVESAQKRIVAAGPRARAVSVKMRQAFKLMQLIDRMVSEDGEIDERLAELEDQMNDRIDKWQVDVYCPDARENDDA